ncbi:MAG TPA: ribbon-helix-helix protein, CopG family [Bryobacteraceae bacterium]|jgi:predicted DNA-binding protein
MNIQYIRLDGDVCERLNRMANEERRTVSDVVNEILRHYLEEQKGASAEQIASR